MNHFHVFPTNKNYAKYGHLCPTGNVCLQGEILGPHRECSWSAFRKTQNNRSMEMERIRTTDQLKECPSQGPSPLRTAIAWFPWWRQARLTGSMTQGISHHCTLAVGRPLQGSRRHRKEANAQCREVATGLNAKGSGLCDEWSAAAQHEEPLETPLWTKNEDKWKRAFI